jgi:nucleotide-binding universal stress UspA family protein
MSQTSSVNDDLLSLRNILLATDFSEYSTPALSHALGIGAQYGSQLYLFHCIDPAAYSMVGPEALQSACDAAWRDMQHLDSELRSGKLTKNVEIKLRVESGEMAAILTRIVKELSVDLIVVGMHGKTGWRKLVLGSVAERIISQVSCPVLAVGPSSGLREFPQFGPRSILFAGDSPKQSALAERYALSLASKYRSRLTTVEIIEDRPGHVVARASQSEWRGAASEDASIKPESTETLQLPQDIGTRGDLILQLSDRVNAGLIVLAAPQVHRLADRFRSSDTYQVLCRARCPVLAVHAQ